MFRKWINSAKQNEFVQGRMLKLSIIKKERSLIKKILKYLWYWAIIIPCFIWENRHDKILMTSTLVSFIIVSATVWLPALISLLTSGWKAALSVASSGLVIWNLPGTPFLLIVLGLGLANKAIYIKFIKPINLRDNAWYN